MCNRGFRLLLLDLTLIVSGCSNQEQASTAKVPTKIIDLSTTITPDLPVRLWGHKALSDFGFSDTTEFRVIEQPDPPLYVSNAYWTLFNHGGTHVDAPNHMDRAAKGIDALRLSSVVGPIRILDFRSRPKDVPIELAAVRAYDVHPGDVVIMLVSYQPPTRPDEIPSFAYLSKEAAEYLATLPIRAIGTDALSVESFRQIYGLLEKGVKGYEELAPIHHAFLPREIPIIEGLVNVDQLVSESNSIFVGLPLKVQNGDGSPIRAVAFVY